ncbi:MAG: hypothetical protein IT452_03890 [Planctomycetia bacterium]|nr:hypothetical protein [Planctomycetia bacterium]
MAGIDPESYADRPGGDTLSVEKLRLLRPDMFGFLGGLKRFMSFGGELGKEYFAEQLMGGDAQPAIVMSVDPLLVAAYVSDKDGVVMLRFTGDVPSLTELKPGARLQGVFSFEPDGPQPRDIIPGPEVEPQFAGVIPLVADFLTDDAEALEETKSRIEPEEWAHTEELAKAYVKLRPGVARDGRPGFSQYPAKGFESKGLNISWK